jgi:uncharacterized protein (TIGR02145 family)
MTENIYIDPRDDKIYNTVKIGGQIWMAKNLNYAVNGDNDEEYYNNIYCDRYRNNAASPLFLQAGRLYTWKQAIKAAPPGWHLPTDKEWQLSLIYWAIKLQDIS